MADSSSIIEGLLVTLTDDLGPKTCVNVSDLDETLSHKIGMIGMTVLMLGNSDPILFAQRHFKLLGPLPIPLEFEGDDVLEAVAVIFNVKVDQPTKDPRALEFGREAIVWFIFQTKHRNEIYSLTKVIEDFTRNKIEGTIVAESDTENTEFFKKMLIEIQSETSKARESKPESTTEPLKPLEIKYSNYTVYKYDDKNDALVPVPTIDEIESLPVFVLVDLKEKQINIVKLGTVNERQMFFVSKAVSNLNAKLKREYTVRNVIDEYEILMYLTKLKK